FGADEAAVRRRNARQIIAALIAELTRLSARDAAVGIIRIVPVGAVHAAVAVRTTAEATRDAGGVELADFFFAVAAILRCVDRSAARQDRRAADVADRIARLSVIATARARIARDAAVRIHAAAAALIVVFAELARQRAAARDLTHRHAAPEVDA